MTNNPEVNLIYSKGRNIQAFERLVPMSPGTEKTTGPGNIIILACQRQKLSYFRELSGKW